VCKREKERERKKKQRENKVFVIFFEENKLPPKNKNKKNALLAGHRAGVPCCPVSRARI
jgi:hypothetical protein